MAAARATLKSLAGETNPDDRRLHELRVRLDQVHSQPGAKPSPELRKLQDAERELWETLAANSSRPLPRGSGDELKRVADAFKAAFPDSPAAPAGPAGQARSSVPAPPSSSESEQALVSAQAAAARASSSRAIADSNGFYDGRAGSRGAVAGPGAGIPSAGAPPTPASAPPGAAPYHFTTVVPASDLRAAPVPAPAGVPPAQDEGFWRGAYHAAKRYAVTTLLPAAKTAAQFAALGNPVTAPLVLIPVATSVADAFRRDNTPSPESARSCAQAVQGTPYFASNVASLCRTSPAVAPVLAGLLDSVKQQFGTVGGIITTVVSLLLGILIGALTGGIGLVIKVLVAVGMTAYAAWQLVSGLKAAMDQYAASKDGSPERFAAIRKVGIVGGSLLLMGVLALLGVGAGKLAAGTRAAGAVNSAASKLVSKLGIESLMAGIDAKIPWLGKLAPAAETEKLPPAGGGDVPGNRSKLTPPEPVAEEPGTPQEPVRKSPNARHKALGVDQGTVAKNVNTVAEPWVPMNEHARIINLGEGVHEVSGKIFRVEKISSPNGPLFSLTEAGAEPKVWRYGVHDNAYYPVDGPGLHILSRGGFKALGLLNTLGPERAAPILEKIGLSAEDRGAALKVWRLLHPGN